MPADIPKLYTALAEWLTCLGMMIAHRGILRYHRITTNVTILTGGFALLCVIQMICGLLSNGLWLVGMFIALLVMWGMLGQILRVSLRSAAFLLARCFLWAEFTAALEWQLDRYYVPQGWEGSYSFSIFFCAVIFTAMILLLILTEMHYISEDTDPAAEAISVTDLVRIWTVALFFFTLSNISYVEVASPFSGTELKEIFNIRTIVDAAGVFMLELLYTQRVEADRRKEVNTIRNVLHTQYMQFRQSQENMDLVNRKYHDLKHQLQVLRAQDDNECRQGYIDEIEKELQIYDMDYKTGSPVLDTILTTKGGQCLRYGIRLHVVADGELLSGIHVIDLATIFGNALDNAIEHEIQIPDENERMIHVSVNRKSRMICIVIENIFRGSLREDGENLLTTKADQANHGYGIKSMRHAVKKYGGIMTAGVEDGWFRVKILLPQSA